MNENTTISVDELAQRDAQGLHNGNFDREDGVESAEVLHGEVNDSGTSANTPAAQTQNTEVYEQAGGMPLATQPSRR